MEWNYMQSVRIYDLCYSSAMCVHKVFVIWFCILEYKLVSKCAFVCVGVWNVYECRESDWELAPMRMTANTQLANMEMRKPSIMKSMASPNNMNNDSVKMVPLSSLWFIVCMSENSELTELRGLDMCDKWHWDYEQCAPNENVSG